MYILQVQTVAVIYLGSKLLTVAGLVFNNILVVINSYINVNN